MRGDFSRQTFTRAKHYAGVLLQQGRVAVDADFNEQQSIVRHRTETEAVDVIGGCGTPLDPPAYAEASGFRIQIAASQTSITIGAGRYYVDGILAENEKTSDYLEQDLPPFEFPSPPPILSLLPDAKEIGLVYLDVWQRQVTPLEDPLIQEKALGEADTATRARTAWQVRVLPLPGVAAPVACNAELAPWNALVAPSTGTLAAITHPPTTAPNPCEPPPSAGFTRLENQLYRVEIHRGGANPTFKWSRENGSILTDARSFAPGNWITVGSMGRDAELGFAKDQWVELVNDVTELNADGSVRGQLTQIADVEPASNAIKLADAPASTNLSRHPRLRRWDMVTHGPPNPVNVTTNGIAIAPGTEQPLEDGISVKFSAGNYHDGDYWLIPARTASADVEWPRDGGGVAIPQPPAGVRHRYCRLGFVQADAGKLALLSDCRRKFPPLTELTSFFYVGGDGQEVMPDSVIACVGGRRAAARAAAGRRGQRRASGAGRRRALPDRQPRPGRHRQRQGGLRRGPHRRARDRNVYVGDRQQPGQAAGARDAARQRCRLAPADRLQRPAQSRRRGPLLPARRLRDAGARA